MILFVVVVVAVLLSGVIVIVIEIADVFSLLFDRSESLSFRDVLELEELFVSPSIDPSFSVLGLTMSTFCRSFIHSFDQIVVWIEREIKERGERCGPCGSLDGR